MSTLQKCDMCGKTANWDEAEKTWRTFCLANIKPFSRSIDDSLYFDLCPDCVLKITGLMNK